MPKQLKFSHKILLAASLVVVVAFALFTLYNDYLQRNAIRANLQSYLDEMGVVTADNIANWLSGRLVLLESLAQTSRATTRPSRSKPWSASRRSVRPLPSATWGVPTANSSCIRASSCRRATTRASALVQGCRGRRPDHADRALRGCGDQRADHHRGDPGAGRRPDPWRDRRRPEPEGAGRHHQLARLQRHGPCVSRQCRRQDPRPPGQDQGQQDAERALPAEHPEPDQPLRRGEPRRQRTHPRLQPVQACRR